MTSKEMWDALAQRAPGVQGFELDGHNRTISDFRRFCPSHNGWEPQCSPTWSNSRIHGTNRVIKNQKESKLSKDVACVLRHTCAFPLNHVIFFSGRLFRRICYATQNFLEWICRPIVDQRKSLVRESNDIKEITWLDVKRDIFFLEYI